MTPTLIRLALVFGLAALHASSVIAADWGTCQRPFSARSPWNARPIEPLLGSVVVPKSDYFPAIAEGKYSTGVFCAASSDKPMEIFGTVGRKGVWNPDAEAFQPSITLPHWPANVIPAEGMDGHADIVDTVTGIVHSFWQLRQVDGEWRTTQYAWTRLDGRGWPEPGHYFQGARAAAVPSMGGLIRSHELNDDDKLFRHALAMSLTFNGLAANPGFVFPATNADQDAAKANSGQVPQGALLMLPNEFDAGAIKHPVLRKVVETLKVYGAYVVDRNAGTPFVIYVENGSHFKLHGEKWDNAIARDLDRIRAALRPMVSASGWLDGDGRPMRMSQALNLLSMRGPWWAGGGAKGVFDTWSQSVVFPATDTPLRQTNATGRNMTLPHWSKPETGKPYRLQVYGEGGAKLRFQLLGFGQKVVLDSGELGDGQTKTFEWPAGQRGLNLTVISGVGDKPSRVGATLQLVEDAER
ncbi:MAG: Atrophin-1 multi-domain protein [Oxalobacteraceae bacterium]|nr:MAG: Atrophin-1 multi-domain protein [Oxalobacteraceae bacterium]